MTRTLLLLAAMLTLSAQAASAQWTATSGPPYYVNLSSTYQNAFVGISTSGTDLPISPFDIRFTDGSWKARVTFDNRERATSSSALVSTDNPSMRLYRPTGDLSGSTYVWWIENNQGDDPGAIGGLAFRTRDEHDGTGQTLAGAEHAGEMMTRMVIQGDGNVGIGTTEPSHLLSVNGTIKAREVIVTDLGWADFVFEPGYDLMPLSDVAQYIEEEGHLPGVPTTAEVEANGVELGDMQALLLQKIEELTLHLIAQDAEIERLRASVAELQGDAE